MPEDARSTTEYLEGLLARVLELPEDQWPARLAELRAEFPMHAERLRRWESAARRPPSTDERTVLERGSVVEAIVGRLERRPDVRLRGSDDAPSAAMPDATMIGKYVVGERIGRGGVGEVMHSRDRDLNREVALKFLRDDHRDKPGMVQRFVEEAQIGGQLQHPGIVPVYDLGVTADGRPFFAMKLVRGQTLDALLAGRPSRSDDQHRFLQVFLQVCQTVAFAHARGVIHRDLKPHNIMVGRFGEVQVVDWGMGKVLDADDGDSRPATASTGPVSVIDTIRRGDTGSESMPGSLLGTPSYMPPEQALGDVGRIGTWSDVFGLGAILCEILTGDPPYTSDAADPRKNKKDLVAQAAHAKLEPARGRLAASKADAELVELCEECLAPAIEARPQDADAVATRMADYLAGVERRAQEARIEAVVAGQRQRLLKLVVAVVVVAFAATGWLWLLADRRADEIATQKLLVEGEKARVEQERARAIDNERRAAVENARFNLLGYRLKLDQAEQAAAALYPAWPDRLPAITVWIAGAEETASKAGEVRAARDALRSRALDPAEADDAGVRAFESAHIEPKLAHVAALKAAEAVRAGAAVEELVLDGATEAMAASELDELARPLVDPDRTVFGEERRGLAIARLAERKLRAGDTTIEPAPVLETLAWALLAVGLDERAIERSDAALAAATESERATFERSRERLGAAVEAAAGGALGRRIAELEAEVVRLRERALDERDWRFASSADAFLHRTLQGLVRDLESFAADSGTFVEVKERRSWAERVFELSIERHRDRWNRARLAILKADGEVASELYESASPLEIEPQLGLVPIGMNPRTKLWEFYHLRSAADPAVIPSHGEDGRIAADEDTGIVLVLVPGGEFVMGAQSEDRSQPNFDPQAQPDERPVRQAVSSYFLSRYELTKAQWRRLSRGEDPSWYRIGATYKGVPVPIGGSHPVDNVSWEDSAELLGRHALRLPTEVEWEYACRAGSTTPWSSGETAASLAGRANVLDRTAVRFYPQWGSAEGGFDDGFAGPAPVGSFEPNAWGLYDVHGNVWEWTSTGLDTRNPIPLSTRRRVVRGGGASDAARLVRSAVRAHDSPLSRRATLGVRVARSSRLPVTTPRAR